MTGEQNEEPQAREAPLTPEDLDDAGVEGGMALATASARGIPTPHLHKLLKTTTNPKLPAHDRRSLEHAFVRYEKWVETLAAIAGKPADRAVTVGEMTDALTNYKRYIDVDIIFDSRDNFLYRQGGQTKLASSVMEEFLPWLVSSTILPDHQEIGLHLGSRTTFAGLSLTEGARHARAGAGPVVRTDKDQDFAVSRILHIRSSHSPEFDEYEDVSTHIAYIAAECKTNLDKTMFQEAVATAHDLKTAVIGSRYFLLAEWLDMPPVDIGRTSIDGVYLLRKAKRIAENVRKHFSTVAGRQQHRDSFVKRYDDNPFVANVFCDVLAEMETCLDGKAPTEEVVLDRGHF